MVALSIVVHALGLVVVPKIPNFVAEAPSFVLSAMLEPKAAPTAPTPAASPTEPVIEEVEAPLPPPVETPKRTKAAKSTPKPAKPEVMPPPAALNETPKSEIPAQPEPQPPVTGAAPRPPADAPMPDRPARQPAALAVPAPSPSLGHGLRADGPTPPRPETHAVADPVAQPPPSEPLAADASKPNATGVADPTTLATPEPIPSAPVLALPAPLPEPPPSVKEAAPAPPPRAPTVADAKPAPSAVTKTELGASRYGSRVTDANANTSPPAETAKAPEVVPPLTAAKRAEPVPARPALVEPETAPAQAPSTAAIATPPPQPSLSPSLQEPPSAPASTAVPPEAPTAPFAITPSIPSEGEITYIAKVGILSAKAVIAWEFKGDHYRLSMVAKGQGLAALMGSYTQTSQGRIGPAGLMPETFTADSIRHKDSATFDWANKQLHLKHRKGEQTVELPELTQDLLSVMFQLAFAPPQGSVITTRVTNGRKLDTYTWELKGEESLNLESGDYRAIRVAKQRAANEDGLEIWFAPQIHYLPVKIVFVGKNGEAERQLFVSSIKTNGPGAQGN